MPKRSSLQTTLFKYARESRTAVLCLLASIAVTVSGLLAAHASAMSDAATKVQIAGLTDRTHMPLNLAPETGMIDADYYTTLPDLVAEFGELTKTGALATARMDGDFAPAKPFIYQGGYSDLQSARDCLATAAWYESGDDAAGQKSVIQVVLNRVSHPSFPKSVCGVVFQGWQRATGCQFSFTCDGSMQRRVPSQAAWARARDRAMDALSGSVDYTVGEATHFHADYVSPWWRSELEPLAKVGAHIFYRWPGKRGQLAGAPARLHETSMAALDYPVADSRASVGTSLDAPGVFEPFDGEVDALTPRSLPLADAAPYSPSGQSIYEELSGFSESGASSLDTVRRKQGQDRDKTGVAQASSPAAKPEAIGLACESIDRRDPGDCTPSAASVFEPLDQEPIAALADFNGQ